jgi:hypothetical protein
MSKNRVTTYIVSHFVGDQSLAWSFFVNAIAFYFLLAAFVVGLGSWLAPSSRETPLGFGVLMILFLCGMGWSLVGNIRSAIKALSSRESHVFKKTFAVLVIGVMLLVVLASIRDLMRWNIFKLIRGLAT